MNVFISHFELAGNWCGSELCVSPLSFPWLFRTSISGLICKNITSLIFHENKNWNGTLLYELCAFEKHLEKCLFCVLYNEELHCDLSLVKTGLRLTKI